MTRTLPTARMLLLWREWYKMSFVEFHGVASRTKYICMKDGRRTTATTYNTGAPVALPLRSRFKARRSEAYCAVNVAKRGRSMVKQQPVAPRDYQAVRQPNAALHYCAAPRLAQRTQPPHGLCAVALKIRRSLYLRPWRL